MKRTNYVIGAMTGDGREIMSAPASVSIGRAGLALTQNCPNPFNPTTSIEFTMPDAENVRLSI